MLHKGQLFCILALAVSGCGGEPSGHGSDAGPDDARTPPADAGPGGDAGERDAGAGDAGEPGALEVDRWGARVYGRVLGLTRVDRTLYVGTSTAVDVAGDGSVRSQLLRLDLDTGDLRVWEEELPRHRPYGDPSAEEGPVATSEALPDGARTLIVARSGILVLADDAITEHPVTTASGAEVSPTHAVLDRSGGRARLWVSTEAGLFRLDPDTLSVEHRLDADSLGTGQVGDLALDPATGAVYAALYFEGGSSSVVRVLDDAVDATLTPGEGDVPAGRVGDVVWSTEASAAYVALASWDPESGGVVRWNGTDVLHVVSERGLSFAARGEEVPFGATVLALDEASGVLVVGGQMRAVPLGSPEGGGVALVDVGSIGAAELQIVGMSTWTSDLVGDHVNAAAYDPGTKRLYLSLQQPCSEIRLGNAGLVAVRFEDGTPRLEMPILSGIRELSLLDGLIAAVRDDAPGIRCEGLNVQGGLVRVAANRSGLNVPLRGTGRHGDPAQFRTTRLGFHALAVRDAHHVAAAAWRAPIYAGSSSAGTLLDPALETGTSLWPYDVAWQSDTVLWIGSRAPHDPSDPATVANTGPRGAARVELATDGSVLDATHYVLANRDPDPSVVEGLPSSEVTAVVVESDGTTWLVSATERVRAPQHDRFEGDPFEHEGEVRRGGLSRVAPDGTLTVVASGDAVPDGRAAALSPEGDLYVLDAERGLLRLDGDALVTVDLPVDPPEGSIPKGLWVGAGGDLVAAFSTGAAVQLDGVAAFLDGVGYAWGAMERADGVVLVGTDEGLLRVRAPGVADVAEVSLPVGELPPYRGYAGGGGGGTCLGEHEGCGSDAECCEGLFCSGSGSGLSCLPRER